MYLLIFSTLHATLLPGNNKNNKEDLVSQNRKTQITLVL